MYRRERPTISSRNPHQIVYRLKSMSCQIAKIAVLLFSWPKLCAQKKLTFLQIWPFQTFTFLQVLASLILTFLQIHPYNVIAFIT